MKYNVVLRLTSVDTSHPDQELCRGNQCALDLAPYRSPPSQRSAVPRQMSRCWLLVRTDVTTIHVLNSGIVKLSHLARAVPVYRGIRGRTLPHEMMEVDQMGVRSAVEPSFTIVTVFSTFSSTLLSKT